MFLAAHPCKLRPQYDPNTNFTDYTVEDIAEVNSAISLIAGDAIHNLRSALDHLAASLVRDAGNTPSKQTYFPICQSPAHYVAESPGKIKGMRKTDIARIDLLKPYLRGEDRLWGLHRMDITDKHDLILTQTQCVGGVNYRISEADTVETMGGINIFGRTPSTDKKIVTVPLFGQFPTPEKGKVLVRFPGNTEKDEDDRFSFDIAFGDVQVFKGRLVLPSLRELANLVQGIVDSFK